MSPNDVDIMFESNQLSNDHFDNSLESPSYKPHELSSSSTDSKIKVKNHGIKFSQKRGKLNISELRLENKIEALLYESANSYEPELKTDL